MPLGDVDTYRVTLLKNRPMWYDYPYCTSGPSNYDTYLRWKFVAYDVWYKAFTGTFFSSNCQEMTSRVWRMCGCHWHVEAGENCRPFVDDVVKIICLTENCWIWTQISLRHLFRQWLGAEQAIIWNNKWHYGDVIMGAIASQITSLTIVYSTVYSDSDQRKHQSSASLAFVRGIHRGPVNSPHKGPVTRNFFPFDDVIMEWVIKFDGLLGQQTVTSMLST